MSAASMDSERRLAELEVRIAHQDQSIQELSDELYRQQQQIALLEARLAHLAERLQSLGGGEPPGDPVQEVPPHY